MTHQPSPPPPRTVWAYAYQIAPPQAEERLRTVSALLARAGVQARQRGQTWESRLVHERQVTHILVVSDSPRQDLEVNQRVNAELHELGAAFSLTAALAVANEPVPPPPLRPHHASAAIPAGVRAAPDRDSTCLQIHRWESEGGATSR